MIDIILYFVYNLAMLKMKHTIRFIILFAAVVLVLSACMKPPQEDENKVPLPTAPTPLPDAAVEISLLLKTKDYVMEDWPVMEELFKRSGIYAAVKTIRPERYAETLSLNLSSGVVYDMMEIPPEYMEAADPYIVDALPLINQYAPNYVSWLNSYSPEMLSALATSRGEIKLFPIRQETGAIKAVPFIKSHVEGRQFDAGSFYNAITQSGGKFAAPGSTYALCELMAPMFGTSAGAFIKNGTLVYGPTTEEFKSMLLYLNSLYMNNMISESFFVYTPTNLLYDLKSGDVTVGIFTQDYYEAAFEAGMEPFMFSPVENASLLGYAKEPASYAAVTDVNGNAANAIKLLDYCFSDDGRRLLNNGIDGVHVKLYGNGVLKELEPYTRYDSFQWKEQGLTPEGMPGVYYNSWMKYSSELYDMLVPMRRYAQSESEIPLSMPVTGANAVASQVVSGSLNPIFHEWWSGFIVGNKSFSEWNSYVNEIKGAGLNTYLNLHYY